MEFLKKRSERLVVVPRDANEPRGGSRVEPRDGAAHYRVVESAVVESRGRRGTGRGPLVCGRHACNYTGTRPVTMALFYIRNYRPTRDTYISLYARHCHYVY